MPIASSAGIETSAKAPHLPQGLKPLTVTVRSACKIAGVGNTTMWKLIRDGKVATISIGRRRLVSYQSLEALLTPPEDGSKEGHLVGERRRTTAAA